MAQGIGHSRILGNRLAGYAGLAIGAFIIIILAIAPLTSVMVEGWSRRDVELRARLVFRSIRDQVASGIATPGIDLVPFFEQLAQDERLTALGFCSADGELRYATKFLPKDIRCKDLTRSRTDIFAVAPAGNRRFHISTFPVAAGTMSGHLLVVHDLSYIAGRVREAYVYSLVALVGVVVGLGLLAAAIMLAVTRSWTRSLAVAMKSITSGRDPDPAQRGFPISKDVRALLTQFRADRKFSEGIRVDWSPKTLHRLLEQELPGAQVLVVSNREPYIHNHDAGKIVVQFPASGLVAALEPVMRACGGTWIAHGSGSADRETVDDGDRIRVPPSDPAYALRRVWLSEEEQDGYYFGFANEGLWPLCHIAFVRPNFREQDWQLYKAVNERFADVVVQEAASDDPVVLVQDYHFALLPRMIRERLPKATIITFWHIPWPNSETFGICPWREEIIDGLLGSSIVGFHTQFHCNNFLEAADRFIESRIDRELASITLGGHETLIRPYPISIEWPPAALAAQAPVAECREAVRRRHGLAADARIVVGIERFDYTKGILDRIRAIDDLITRQPKWRGKLVFIQAAAPTRGKLSAYSDLQQEAIRLAGEVNARHGKDGYKPILLVIRHHEPNEVFELFRAADVCIVSSLHDGMNLVSKEFVASRDDEQGVLLLSSFTGASRELAEALIVNPYDTSGMADMIGTALQMPADEQRERMRLMRDSVRQRNVYRWAAQMLFDAAQLRRRERIPAGY